MTSATSRLPSRVFFKPGLRLTDYVIAFATVVGALLGPSSAVPWVRMWVVAGALFLAFKWLTQRSETGAGNWKTLGYFIVWPGLDADQFFRRRSVVAEPAIIEWIQAFLKTCLGAGLIWGVVRFIPADQPRLIGALGMIGIVCFLHFGLFHLLALIWQHGGTDVRTIMNSPAGATSVADFWGNRWNRAYRRVSLDYFFRPFVARYGAAVATVIAFFISGIIHELVISFPAGAGYGLPTVYFVLQGLALLAERSRLGRRFLEQDQIRGRVWTALVTIGPVGMLFHAPFLTRVILPFLQAIGAS